MSSAPWGQKISFTQATTPSYTAVSARRAFERPTAGTTTTLKAGQQTKQTSTKMDFPQAVRDYVSRAFMSDKEMPGIDRVAIQEKLKQVITEASEQGMLHSMDWSTYPLPQEIIQSQREASRQTTIAHIQQLNYAAALSTGLPKTTNTMAGKKRKSSDMDTFANGGDSNLPPWRQSKSAGLDDRIEKTSDKRQKRADEFRAGAAPSKLSDLEKRRQRFDLRNTASSSSHVTSRGDSPVPSATSGPVIGTNEELEKKYFRLTAPPKPETVRPLRVLEKTLDLLTTRWKEQHNYGYICDQFKSLRQDLTVQHIKTEFTVRVYESHARIALEKGDMGEYNQCQTQLRPLHKKQLGGSPGEFMAYRILYFIYTRNRTGMNDILADLTPAEKAHPAVDHALLVRSAIAAGNFHKLFRLYLEAPYMGAYLMDKFADRERVAALTTICKAYKVPVSVKFLAEELAFASQELCSQFLCECGGEDLLESRKDGVWFITGKAGKLFENAMISAFQRIDIKGQI